MPEADLSSDDAKSLRKLFDDALAAQVATSIPIASPAGSLDFCTVWPEAKPVIQALSGMAALIPGLGPVTTASLTALVAVGDLVHRQTCSTSGKE